MDLLSAVGLLFAAIAAAASVLAVALTVAYDREQKVRRLAESLIAVRSAAAAVKRTSYMHPEERGDKLGVLQDALVELQRALAVRLPAIPNIDQWLDRLLDEHTAGGDAVQTEQDAAAAYNELHTWEPPSGWRRVIGVMGGR